MKKSTVLIAIAATLSVALSLPSVASAVPITYTYIGNAFNDFIDSPSQSGTYDASNHVEVTLTTIDGYLPDTSLADISSYLASWSFTDGRYTLDNTMSDVDPIVLWAGITSGAIDSWNMVAEFNTLPLPIDVSSPRSRIVTVAQAGFVQDSGSLGHYLDEGGTYARDFGSIADAQGVWSTTQPAPVPEPSTMLLLGSGLLGVVAFKRKFNGRKEPAK